MWYTLQVMTGYEMEIAYRIRQRAGLRPGLISDAVACLKHVASFAPDLSTRHTYERVIPSYVFVSLDGPMTAEAYQFLRLIPGIFRIFTIPVSDQEMAHLFELMEPQVEVSAEEAEEKARQFRRELRRELLRVYEYVRQSKLKAQRFFRGLREFLRVPSRELRRALTLLPPASQPDPLTVLCVMVT